MKSLTIVVFVAVLAFAWAEECKQGENKISEDGCNNCFCANGNWACTQKACLPTRAKRQVCAERAEKQENCNSCRCVGGNWACTRRACPPSRNRRAAPTPNNCNPGERFKDDCNWCTCGRDGRSAACSLALCPH